MRRWRVKFDTGIQEVVKALGVREAWHKGNELRKAQPGLGRIVSVSEMRTD